MPDRRGCSLQRPVDRLVTTPQTVQSFMDQGALAPGIVAPHLTLVTLDCRAFDIAMSVSEAAAPVYSPAVLRLRGQARASKERIAQGTPWRTIEQISRTHAGATRLGPSAASARRFDPLRWGGEGPCSTRCPNAPSA